jgi:hypothetical protein
MSVFLGILLFARKVIRQFINVFPGDMGHCNQVADAAF